MPSFDETVQQGEVSLKLHDMCGKLTDTFWSRQEFKDCKRRYWLKFIDIFACKVVI